MMHETVTHMLNNAHTDNYQEGDYYKDGILYCGKCRTRKQLSYSLFGKGILVGCLCECQAKERAAKLEAEEKVIAEKQLAKMRSAAFPDPILKSYRFDQDDGKNPQVSQICKNYVRHFNDMKEKHEGLLLYGPVGTGKTYFAVAIANALLDVGVSCLVTNFSRLTNTLFELRDGKQEYLDALNKYDLLVIDDLGTERDTEYMIEQVSIIIDSRYRSGKPLIVTTNLTPEELKHPADKSRARIYSRLLGMCIPVEVAGEDRRKIQLRDSYNNYKRLLTGSPEK